MVLHHAPDLPEVLVRELVAGGAEAWLALKTLLSPLLGDEDMPAWCGLRPSRPNFVGANVMFDAKIERADGAPVRCLGTT